MFPAMWDVSSLVLWNKQSVIGEYYLGKISQLKNKGDLITNIVNKINKLNNLNKLNKLNNHKANKD